MTDIPDYMKKYEKPTTACGPHGRFVPITDIHAAMGLQGIIIGSDKRIAPAQDLDAMSDSIDSMRGDGGYERD